MMVIPGINQLMKQQKDGSKNNLQMESKIGIISPGEKRWIEIEGVEYLIENINPVIYVYDIEENKLTFKTEGSHFKIFVIK